MRLSGTKTSSVNQYNGLGDQLYDLGGAKPTLDLNFSSNESLVDSVTGKTLVDHTRQSSATYVDGDGVIRTAVTNLLQRSEEFDNTYWTATNCTVLPNETASPTGAVTAQKQIHTGSGPRVSKAAAATVTASSQFTFSFFVKAGTSSYAAVSIYDGTIQGNRFWFNITTGVPGSITNIGSGYPSASSQMEAFPNGWYRCICTITNGSNTTVTIDGISACLDTNGVLTPAVSGIYGYLWGAQLEESSTVGEYVKTTTAKNGAPRFDHDPTTGESLGLLVEEARTNSVRNNTMVGAVAGTPGTVPTNWTATTPANGITREIVGTGTEDGIAYVDIKFSGTNTLGSNFYMDITFDSGTITAAQNQAWTESCYVKLVAGVITGSAFTTGPRLILYEVPSFASSSQLVSTATSDALVRQRFSLSRTLTDAATTAVSPRLAFNVATGGTIDFTLRIGMPQLEQGAFATSVIPTSTATVTRAADVASIEGRNFGSVNLLSYSEEFDNAAWTKIRSTISANAVISPFGDVSADKLVEDSTASSTHFITRTTALGGTVDSSTYAISFYAKAAERNRIRVIDDLQITNGATIFDLANGTVVTGNGSILNTGNGWYRCTIYPKKDFGTNSALQIYLISTGTTFTYDGDGSSGLYVWGAQLEEGSTATDYIKSDVNFTSRGSTATYYDVNGVIQTAAVDEARTAAYLPDGNGNFVSAGDLLLEGAGTNLLLQSEDFSTTWTTTRASVSTNAVAAPDGLITADKLIEDNTPTNSHTVSVNSGMVAGTTYTYSVFAKAAERSWLVLSPGSTWGYGWFNVSTGSLGTLVDGGSGATAKIEAYPNGWYRCSITATAVDNRGLVILLAAVNGSVSYTGDGTSGIYLWGAQLEQSSYPTSYIPTSGSTATRAADVSTSAATFGNSWYEQDEGTVFVDFLRTYSGNFPNFPNIYNINDGTVANRIVLFGGQNQQFFRPLITAGGVDQTDFVSFGSNVPSPNRSAHSFAVNNSNFSGNGSSTAADTSLTMPVVNKLDIGVGFGQYSNAHIRRLTYWPARLPNETLQTITV